MSESKTAGFWEVSERNRWEEKATTAFSGLELTSGVLTAALAVRTATTRS
jgi:hypothetical protein